MAADTEATEIQMRTTARLGIKTFSTLALALAITLPPAAAQNRSAAPKTAAPKAAWTQPRTPSGDPDIQGIWSNASIIPLERPKELEGKQVLTPQEMEAYEARVFQRSSRERP